MHLKDIVEVRRVLNAQAAGSTDITSATPVDLKGYDGVMFVALFGALTANQVTSLRGQQSSDNGSSDDFSDIEGSKVGPLSDDDDNDMLVLDVFRPAKRYVKPVIDRETANAVVDGVIALLYRAREVPVTQGASVIDAVGLVTPAEGTP